MTTTAAETVRPLDPRRLLADEGAMSTLRRLAKWLRQADRGELDPDGPEHAAAVAASGGQPLSEEAAVLMEPLRACGAVGWEDDQHLAFVLFNRRGLVTFIPRAVTAGDVIYLGTDSVRLLKLAWQRRRGGARALDLGCGAGFASAALMSRYDMVVAADYDARAAAATAVTIALNRPPSRRAAVLQGDIGSALADRSFDLIIANPPWVPTDERLGGTVFADGGATGSELPRRFVRDTARLLAPGGLGIVLMLDTTWADGSRPAARIVEEVATTDVDAELHHLDAPEINQVLAHKAQEGKTPFEKATLAAILINRP